MMAFKATSEPKLRAEMRSDTTRTMMRELTGMSQPGRTYTKELTRHLETFQSYKAGLTYAT